MHSYKKAAHSGGNDEANDSKHTRAQEQVKSLPAAGQAGESVEITERGTPIGRIIPTALLVQGRIEAMARSGLLLWNK